MGKKSKSGTQDDSLLEPSYEQVKELFDAVEGLEALDDEMNNLADGDLLDAAERGDSEDIAMALELGANPNAQRSEEGESALLLAITSGKASAVRALLEAGAARDMTCELEHGTESMRVTPIAFAHYRREAKIVELLADGTRRKKRGAVTSGDAGSPDSDLGLAALYGDAARAREALAAGASPNGRDPDRGTPWLALAISGGAIDVVDVLLRAGADPNLDEEYGGAKRSMLELARLKERFEVVKLLRAAGARPSPTPYRREPPSKRKRVLDAKLVAALRKRDAKTVHARLMTGADPNAVTDTGEPLIAMAVRSGSAEIVRELLHCEAYPDAEHDGVTVLALAVERGDVAIVKELLLENADPNRGKTLGDALAALDAKPQEEILRELLKWGLDPDLAVGNESLVARLARDGRDASVELLRAHGARD
ncbi:MAG: hypothetical protein HOV81_08195 [Kofleriaceae bacterium]|nr:hypothetical protein [Kofleriaceae bacterium]